MAGVQSREIKNFVTRMGADLVGVAPADCVEPASNRRGPLNVMPEARAMVVFAKRMLRGSLESPRDEVVTTMNLVLYEELDRIAYALGEYLEARGFRAATVPAYSPVEMTAEAKGMVGVVSLRHAAQAAGLGVLGKNNLLLTPLLGPRVRLGGVVTDVALAPDTPLNKDLCKDCEACVKACPADALSEPGQTRTGRCVRQVLPYGLTGLIQNLTDKLDRSVDEGKAFLKEPDFWNLYQSVQLGLQYGCHACINACPIGAKSS
jgi:epoxyqueuosine reductase QueG